MKVLRKVSRVEVSYNGGHYYHPALAPCQGAMVFVKERGASLEIRDFCLRFICVAPPEFI